MNKKNCGKESKDLNEIMKTKFKHKKIIVDEIDDLK